MIDSSYQIVKPIGFRRASGSRHQKAQNRRCYTLLAGRRTPCVGCPVGSDAQPQGGTRIQLKEKRRKISSYGLTEFARGSRAIIFNSTETFLRKRRSPLRSFNRKKWRPWASSWARWPTRSIILWPILATSQILLGEDGLDASLRDDLEEIRRPPGAQKRSSMIS